VVEEAHKKNRSFGFEMGIVGGSRRVRLRWMGGCTFLNEVGVKVTIRGEYNYTNKFQIRVGEEKKKLNRNGERGLFIRRDSCS